MFHDLKKINKNSTIVFNINNLEEMFLERQISTLKVSEHGVMMLKIQLCNHRDKLHFKYILIKKWLFYIYTYIYTLLV